MKVERKKLRVFLGLMGIFLLEFFGTAFGGVGTLSESGILGTSGIFGTSGILGANGIFGANGLFGTNGILGAKNASAASSLVQYNLTMPVLCAIEATTTTAHSTTLNPGELKENIGSTTLTTYCNDDSGFAIYAIGSSDETLGNTNLVSASGTENIATGTATSGSTSSWGIKITEGDDAPTLGTFTTNSSGYLAVPSVLTRIASKDSASATTGSKLNITFYAFVADLQTSGTYTGEVTYTLVQNDTSTGESNLEIAFQVAGKEKVSVNGEEYYKMQDMNSTICDMAQAVGEASQIQLVDIRDYKLYWVAKLEDGNCWMTQNLDFDLSTATTLTSETTDLNVADSGAYNDGYSDLGGVISWTPGASTIDISNGSVPDNFTASAPVSYDVGEWYETEERESTSACDFLTNSNCSDFSTTPFANNGTHGSVGNYYNWTAAIASNSSSSLTSSTYNNPTSSPANSICPAGWRLPTVSSSDASTAGSTNEFSRLNYLYNSGSTSTDAGLFVAPLYFVHAGYVTTGLYNSEVAGSYWSSTVNDSSSAYSLYFYSYNASSAAYPIHSNVGRGWAISTRCVAR